MTSAAPPGSLAPLAQGALGGPARRRQADRFPHALLLTGPAGVGKRRLLEALAHSLLCHGTLAGGWACGQCPDCRLLAAGTHPDLARVGPDEEGKSGEIKVDAIRALAGAESLTAHRGGWKLILIDPAHRLNTSAANALLKTLEEPAPSTLLCLVSEQPSRLPATIRSRCQVLRLAVPPEVEALAWLAPRTAGFDAATLLHLAHGAPLRALELANPERLALRDRLIRGFVEVAQGKRDPLGEAVAWNQAEPALLLDWLGGWVSDLLRLIPELLGSPGQPRLINADWAGDFRALAAQVDPAAGHRFLRQVWRVGASDTTNLNRLLLFETWLLEWARLYSPAAGHHSR
jgi:DNA polymerase-3 subunit delta'